MIKIIAIQPEVMSSQQWIREYLKDFGTGRGRWIPLVPSDWRTCVSQAIKRQPDLKPVEKNFLRDKITNPRNRDKFVKIEECPELAGDWNKIVNDFLIRGDFDGAIVSSPVDSNTQFLVAHQFDPEIDSYSVKTTGFVARKPDELVAPIISILRFAKEVHVIDKYCYSAGSSTKSYARFFEDLVTAWRGHSSYSGTITLHRKYDKSLNFCSEKINYESWVLPFLRDGESFRVHYLEENSKAGESIHMRAIFTDSALVSGHYGYGGGAEFETTNVVLHEHSDLLKIRGDYLDEKTRAFKLHEPLVIEGRKS